VTAAAVVDKFADTAAAGLFAGGGADALISSKGSSFNSHTGLGALGATATSCFIGPKHSIST